MSISFCSIPARRYGRARVIVGVLALCCMAPAWAVPTINTSTSFAPADGSRTYMDSGGVWNGSAEVTNTTGDIFRITLSNTAAGLPNPLVNDVAFDIALTLDVPAGFRLPASPFAVTATNNGGDTNCIAPAPGSITATQAGGVGTPITFNFPANTNLPARGAGLTPCSYTLSFGLTTTNVAPFVAGGSYILNYSFRYNTVDNDSGTQQTVSPNQNVEVRRGDIIVTKTAVSNPANQPEGSYADGETAQWTVSVHNNGTGGAFAVQLTDTPNVNFDASTLQLALGAPGVNQYTVNYLPFDQQVDINVRAQVAVPPGGTSCPDLRNDVSVIDRLQNTSSAFASVVLDLQDPLLDYTAPSFSIGFGTPTTVSFNVTNNGSGPARNVQLRVSGLGDVTITPLPGGEWIYNVPTSTFIHVGADSNQDSGDEIIAGGGGTSLLQFDAEMNTCGGTTGGFLTWTPRYQNICGLIFNSPLQNSVYAVTNSPDLVIDKNVGPTGTTNFGLPASYTLDLLGVNIPALTTTPGADNDWIVTDTLPAGVGSGNIPTVPAGTIIIVGGTTYTDTDTNIAVAASDDIIWRGDREDLLPVPPSITIDFVADSAGFCPTPGPPVTFTNSVTLEYPSCNNLTTGDSVSLLVNDSPVNSMTQAFDLANGANSPFETGRPNTDPLVAEPNEGEPIVFRADYPFENGYAGQWDDSSFSAEMGTGTNGLAGDPLQLAFTDLNDNDVPDLGEITEVTVEVINNNAGGTSYPRTRLPVGISADPGVVVINPNGSITIPDLDFIGDFIGDNSMSNMELIIEYMVTAPEGNLDLTNPDPALRLQPLDAVNVAAFEERVTITVANDPTSCAGDNVFVQGIGVALARADVVGSGSIDPANNAGACGVTTANLNVLGPSVASALRGDNIRILLQSTDYDLPTDSGVFSYGGAGNFGTLGKNFTLTSTNGQIEITPDTDNLIDLSTISFPIILNPTATGRVLEATIFYDSNHTSPDYAPEGADEDYSFGPFTLNVPTQTANLNVEFFPPSLILGDPAVFADVDGVPGDEGVFTWRVRITNIGTSPLSNYVFTNEVPPGFLPYRAGSIPVADPALPSRPDLMVWSLPGLNPGESTEITVAIGLAQNAGCNVGTLNDTSVHIGCLAGTEIPTTDGPSIDFPIIDLQLEHRDTSYCELCRTGTVELEVRNEGASDLYDLFITEELAGSGLEYVPGTGFVTFEGGAPIALEPVVSGTQLIWDTSNLGALISSLRPGEPQLFSDLNGTPSELVLSFDLRSSKPNPEDLLTDSRQITALAQFDLFCGDPGRPPVSDVFTVPLRQPQPTVDKQGRNYSARQSDAQYSDSVFGGTDDVLVWRVDVQNSGITSSADLEDLLVNDTIGGNFNLRYICPNEAAATAMAAALETAFFASSPAPAPVAPCIDYATANPLDVDDPFGNPENDEPGTSIDAEQGESAFIYYVGEILAFCQNWSNDANIEWGCQNSPAPGGVNDSTPGVVNSDDSDGAIMSTQVSPSGVSVTQTVTGVNTAQPVGTKGIVTIDIENLSGGTIRNLVLEDILPEDYQLDPEWFAAHPLCTDRMTVNTAYGFNYPGRVNICTHINNGDPDGFIEPRFSFTENDPIGTPNQQNLLRHGDSIELRLGIIRVRPFDDTADPEVREEEFPITDTDPDYSGVYTNDLRLDFFDTCSNPFSNDPAAEVVAVNPEDLDIDINEGDPDLFFILADPAATLQMDVRLRNRGGHDAADYDAYVTVGDAINIISIDPGAGGTCTQLTPAEEAALVLPPPIWNPATASVYRCINQDPLPPAAFNDFRFVIERDTLDTTGDLTFRADVIGRTTQFDGNTTTLGATESGFPNYSLDNILARMVGFAMSKTLLSCNETDSTDPLVIIGEECTYRIEAEWFGFATPGFGSIVINNASIFDGAPGIVAPPQPVLGQRTVGDPALTFDCQPLGASCTPGIVLSAQTPANPVAALSETGFRWDLNPIATNTGSISETFIADVTFRTANDPVNNVPAGDPPNQHGTQIIDEANARFEVFFPDTGSTQTFNETSGGYPPTSDRQAAINIIEPSVTLTKEVCNESESIDTGANCAPFVTLAPGESDDTFIYRLRLTNEDTAAGFQRAPAFDVTVDDVLDATDQAAPLDFATDSLDNDGDGLVDAADTDGEGTVDNIVLADANPADINFNGSHSSALARIGPNETVTLLYRVQLAGSVVTGQLLSNTADGGYDSLPGDFGNQSAPQLPTGDIGGARLYDLTPVQTTVEVAGPVGNAGTKSTPQASRIDDPTPFGGSQLEADTCTEPVGGDCLTRNVVIGEEVLVQLEFTLPLGTLDELTVEDNLPPGLECIQPLDITLPAVPADPGFNPGGGPFAGTCSATQVRWTLGDQVLQGTSDYTVTAQFIGRVRNIATNIDGAMIRNGGGIAGGGTTVFLSYRDATNVLTRLPVTQSRLRVREPQLALLKTMTPVPLNTSVDAVDRMDVAVLIQNNGTSPAYGIELMDTLGLNLSYVTNSSLTATPANPAHSVDLSVPATPRFSFTDPLPPGASFTFRFQVQADSEVAPLEVLSDTINARFKSLPDNTVALNTNNGGVIGLDGAANGMRVGFLPPTAGSDPLNDYEAQSTASLSVPGLQLTKTDMDSAIVPTIGARKHFRLILDLPESTAGGVVVNDNLSAAGPVSFVLENDAANDITYTFRDIVSISNGTAVAGLVTPDAVETALVAFTAIDEATGVVTWDFGTVVTEKEDDASVNNFNPQIIIDYYARVANEPATVAGVNLQNAANADTDDPAPPVDAPPVPPVIVAEPDLQVDKQFVDLPLPTPSGTVLQGSPAEFLISVTNVGTSTAWDATIVDMLPNRTDADVPGGMCDSAPVITQIEVGGRALTAGTDYTTSFVPPASAADLYCSFTIVLTPTVTTNDDARIVNGETLSIRYTATPDIGTPANSSLTNVAGATQWFSRDTDGVTVAPETRQYDRTLTLRPDPNPGTVGIDDWQDAVTVLTAPPDIDVTKSVANLTTGQDPTLTASPGDTLHYTIVVSNSSTASVSGVQILDEPDAINILNFPDGYFENSPGDLRNILVNGFPVAAADDFSDPAGGGNGSGLLDIRNQTLPGSGQLVIEFDIDVESPDQPLPHAFIENVARAQLPGFSGSFDSPPTQTEIINTATGFEFDKNSLDVNGAPLVAGDILRYTIEIRNVGDPANSAIGLMHAVNAVFRDQVPAHTTYVTGSTRLNGITVPDVAGVPPFVSGMPVNSPDSAIPGFITANRLDNSSEIVVSFEVTINGGLVNGTVISNHAVLTGEEQALPPFTPLPFPGEVSNDPDTVSVPDDPTQDTVGSGVNVDALKTVQVITGGDPVPDTGDTLRYTIVVVNNGNATANNVVLFDAAPAGTTYVAGSVTLNGNPIIDPVLGTSPLSAGMGISSIDLLPNAGVPMAAPASGQLSPSPDNLGNERAATITFDVTITASAGTAISNQGTVRAGEQPDEPTDSDGNDENGDQPTVVVVGGAAQLEIIKEVVVVGGGTAQPNGQLEYRISVENTGELPANNVVVTDIMPALTAYATGSGQINGLTAGISFTGSTLTADYSSVYGPLAPDNSFIVTFRVTIDPSAQPGDDINNTATVAWTGGNASDGADIDIGGAPGVVNLSGRIWHNLNHNAVFNAGEPPLAGWRVRVYVNNPNPTAGDTPLAEVLTDAQGLYDFTGLAPVDAGDTDGAYTLAFSVPPVPAAFPAGSNIGLGDTISDFGITGLMITNNINIPAGRNAQDESLPVDPMGNIYNSISRSAVQGARVTLLDDTGNAVPGSCFTTPAHLDSQQGQITSALGFYRFDLNFSGGGCPSAGADYTVSVEVPDSQGVFSRNVSDIILPETGVLNVPSCPDGPIDRVPSPPSNTCEVQPQSTIPAVSTPVGLGTRYFLRLNLASGPEELFNNHVPVDLNVGSVLSITKQTPLKNVVRGQLVPYTITVTNAQSFPVAGMELRDFFPPGFKYVEGSAVIDGQPVEPVADVSGFNDDDLRAGTLSWNDLSLQPDDSLTLKLLLIVGAGVGEGEYTNQAQVFVAGLRDPVSGRASATVRVVSDPTFDCSDIIGKVYDDRNANGYPDEGEPGIAGARVASARGLLSTTDKYGRFHIMCAAVPDPDRGSNFILKLDERSLPSGYRVTTENPRVQRLTRGKVAKFNFGVTLHRVVRLDLADQAFEYGGTAVQAHWTYVLDDLITQLREQPSILRITYLAENESQELVQQRVDAIHELIATRWRELNCCYDLKIEIEFFWRTGSPE